MLRAWQLRKFLASASAMAGLTAMQLNGMNRVSQRQILRVKLLVALFPLSSNQAAITELG